MITRRVALIGLLLLCSHTGVGAFERVPTQCRFAETYGESPVDVSFGAALVQLARLSDAKMQGDQRRSQTAARDVARLIAGYPAGYRMRVMLDVVHRLDLGGLDREAVQPLFRRFLEVLDPVARQSSETSTGHLSAYLQAHDYLYGAAGDNRYQRLKDLQKRIRNGPECFERRFFLLLRLAKEIGAFHGQTVVRPELEILWKEADSLKGIGIDQSPLKWTAFSLLTARAVEFQQFDLAEPWLAKTIEEAAAVKAAPGVAAETVDIVDSLMVSLPNHVEQEKAAYKKRLAAGLE
jgi:hypothetical protein